MYLWSTAMVRCYIGTVIYQRDEHAVKNVEKSVKSKFILPNEDDVYETETDNIDV